MTRALSPGESREVEMKPQRIQLSRRKGFRLQEESLALNGLPAVKVDRTGPWGNPFKIAPIEGSPFRPGMVFEIFKLYCTGGPGVDGWTGKAVDYGGKKLALAKAVELHREWIMSPEGELLRRRARKELAGHNVACWCKPGDVCHGDTLLALANVDSLPKKEVENG